MLPGLYRYSRVKDACQEHYFDLLNRKSSRLSLTEALFKLAEDRSVILRDSLLLSLILVPCSSILSANIIIRAMAAQHEHVYTGYEPSAVFYFQAEVDFTILIQQRRRW